MGRQERRGVTWAVGHGHSVLTPRSHVGTGGPAPAGSCNTGSCNSYRTPGSQRRPLLIELSLVLGVSFFPLKGNPRRMFLSSSSLELSLARTEGLVTEEIKGVSFKCELTSGFPYKCLLGSAALQTEPTGHCLGGTSQWVCLTGFWGSGTCWPHTGCGGGSVLRYRASAHRDEPEHPMGPGPSPQLHQSKRQRAGRRKLEGLLRCTVQGGKRLSQADP